MITLALCGCGAGRKSQTTKVIVEPTVVGTNLNGSGPVDFKELREELKREVKALEHNCPEGYDLLVTPPSSAKCVPESQAGKER